MKGVLYYFSGTGNTKWVADKFEENFEKIEVNLEVRNIEDSEELNIDGFDFLVLGSSVYGETEPKIVDDFIRRLPCNKSILKTIVYATQGGKSSSAPCIMAKKLQGKGYDVVIQAPIQMPNNYFFVLGKKPSKDEFEKTLNEACQKVENIINDFIQHKNKKECNSFFRLALGNVFGKGFIKMLPKLSKNIASTKECNKCGLCLRNCPKSNITFENGCAVFHSKCMLCLRCLYICPLNAITYKGKKIEQIEKNIIKHLHIK